MKTDLVHQPVHYEGGTSHISGIFQKGDEQIQKHDVREEDKHASHTAYDSVSHQILQPAIMHCGADKRTELLHQPLDPPHRILSEDKGTVKDQIQKEEEDGKSKPPVCDNGINPVGQGTQPVLSGRRGIGLGQGSLYKGILRIDQSRLHIGVHKAVYPFLLFKTGGDDFIPVWKRFNDLLDFPVILKVLDGKIPRRILIAESHIDLKELLYPADALLQLRAMIDMDVTGDKRVALFVDLYDGVEQFLYSAAGTADRRDHRQTQKP